MRNRVQCLVMVFVVMTAVSGCNKLGVGMVTETYVNQKDSSQLLELTSKETAKGMIGGRLVTPEGRYTLQTGEKTVAGKYIRRTWPGDVKHPDGTEAIAYVLNLDSDKELKLWLMAGKPALRDDASGVWKLQSRSHQFRSSD